ncbi:hypothetical protein J7E63_07540 [Bacillus sp. ISL-75]|uniref:hypothetical protein n=1 Tax=Bacillus sp. ISL-75 TaxID=2819137 RepID=UPI001BE510F4|nr:hypothetical protein [Bacillus sp. ISL-75]MBT2726787.1 hypothetical protein [Bacillus sp. ISL-75]
MQQKKKVSAKKSFKDSEDVHQPSLNLEFPQLLIKRAMPIITGMERISTLKPRQEKQMTNSTAFCGAILVLQ